MTWHGYLLLEKPGAFDMATWIAFLGWLGREVDTSPDDPQPARRLHYRLSNNKRKIIIESTFPDRLFDVPFVAERVHTKWNNAYQESLTDPDSVDLSPPLSVSAIENSLRNNVTVWKHNERWELSREDCIAYLKANSADWEIEQ